MLAHNPTLPLPPQDFMDAVAGNPTTAEMHVEVGRHVYEVVRERCTIGPMDTVLDIGSGCGRVAMFFAGRHAGHYHGIDIMLPMVEWCRENISTPYPNFRFHHADLANTLYLGGAGNAADYIFPFDDATFDVVFATSVFTHLLPPSARQYAREVARVLKPGGRALLTFCLTNDAYRERLAAGASFPFGFPYQLDGYSVASLENPEGIVAFEEEDARTILVDAGLRVLDLSLGSWSGNENAWTGQDAILLTVA